MEGWRRLVVVVALPRSGTTVTTAVLGAHAQVRAIYEPWNANRETIDATRPMAFDAFVERFAPDPRGQDTLLVKETSTLPPFVDRVDELLATAPAGVERRLLVVLRDPFHVFLSEVQARREWWGEPDLAADAAAFERWAARSRRSLARLARLAYDHDGLFLSYVRLARSPERAQPLTRAVGLKPEPAQLRFEEVLNPKDVRGDQSLAREPRALTDASTLARQEEFKALQKALAGARDFRWMVALRRLVHALPLVAPAREQGELMAHLRG